MRRVLFLSLLVTAMAACGSSTSPLPDLGPATDPGTPDAGVDTGVDTALPDVPVTPDVPVNPDVPVTPDVPEDLPPADADAAPLDNGPTDPGPEDVPDAFGPDIPDVVQAFPPRTLVFAYTRAPEGEAIPDADVTAFTKKVTGLWKKADWARWVLRTSEGVDASTGKADFLGWYNDVTAVKAGDTVTFQCKGGEHNMWIPGSKVLSEAINGYLLTGDWVWGKLAEQYCKGLTAVVKGFIWDENDPAKFLMARSIFPGDNSFTLDAATWKDDGRKKAVEFHHMYHVEDGWNAHTFEWPHNPTWGYEWVTNMRSKDDVRAIVRTTMFLPYLLADAKDDFVKQACQETWDTMVGFNKDIVDSGYNIRTKDKTGQAYVIPCNGEGGQDLGSYMCYHDIDPTNECCARVASDLIAYGEVRVTDDCNGCVGSIYDSFAEAAHFYNYPIIWDYHMAAVGLALLRQENEFAWYALDGLRQRIDRYMHPSKDEPGQTSGSWDKERAVLLVQSAAVGLPLTAFEARFLQKQWSQAVDEFSTFANWDPWAASVPDGEVAFRPGSSSKGIDIEAITQFLEYCNSPFQNPAGVKFVDCDIVKDPSKWGE